MRRFVNSCLLLLRTLSISCEINFLISKINLLTLALSCLARSKKEFLSFCPRVVDSKNMAIFSSLLLVTLALSSALIWASTLNCLRSSTAMRCLMYSLSMLSSFRPSINARNLFSSSWERVASATTCFRETVPSSNCVKNFFSRLRPSCLILPTACSVVKFWLAGIGWGLIDGKEGPCSRNGPVFM